MTVRSQRNLCDRYFAVAATILVGVAVALAGASRTEILGTRSDRDAGATRSAANASRAIVVVIENCDANPFEGEPRLAAIAREGVTFAQAFRVSSKIHADLYALAAGLSAPSPSVELASRFRPPALRSIASWQHGVLRRTRDLGHEGFSHPLSSIGYLSQYAFVDYIGACESERLESPSLLRAIRTGAFDADIAYFEYSAQEANTVSLIEAIAAYPDWRSSLVFIVAIATSRATATEHREEPIRSEPMTLFVKFPNNEFAGRTSTIAVSSYDIGIELRSHFGNAAPIDTMREMLRDEPRFQRRFIFGGDPRSRLSWVRAGTYEFEVSTGRTFDVEVDPSRRIDISAIAPVFVRQARQLAAIWPSELNRMFTGHSLSFEGYLALSGPFIDPFAGNPSHFIYK